MFKKCSMFNKNEHWIDIEQEIKISFKKVCPYEGDI